MQVHRLVPLVALALSGCVGQVQGYPEDPELSRELAETNALAVKGGQVKVTICHVPPGNPSNAHAITIGAPAVAAHLAHGDNIGSCGDCQVDPTAPDCETCGNGQIDDDEQCDGDALGGATCASFGFSGGSLVCTSSCSIDRSGCTNQPPPPPPGGECSVCDGCASGQACVDGVCGACQTSADCCEPLQCFGGRCSLF